MKLSDTIQKLQRSIIGRHNGIIEKIEIIKPYAGSWPFYYGYASLCDVGMLNQVSAFRPPAAGIGLSQDEAMISILGEAVERYCAAFQQKDSMISGSVNSLSKNYRLLSSKDLSCYSTEQHQQQGFPYQKQLDSDIIEWQILSNFAGKKILVPAAYVYLPFQSKTNSLLPSNSTGLACGPSYDDAVLSALFEVVERDAYSLCWLFSGTPAKLCLDRQTHLINQIPCYFHKEWQVDFYDLTARENIPVILCVLRAPRSYAKISRQQSKKGEYMSSHWYCHGVAAHSNPETALVKSFHEAMLGYYFIESQWQKFMSSESTTNSKSDSIDPTTFFEHSGFYNHYPHHLKYCEFIDAGDTVDWGQSKGSSHVLAPGLNSMKQHLHQHNITAAHLNLSTPDMDNSGMHVARVILKGFNYLQGDNRMPTLGTERALNPHQYYDFIAPFSSDDHGRRNNWPHSLG
ncbi:hypothetical protein MNBD_GAMMA12-3690 [hydrothermal vent metagenome]|uniref:YcaO domain-containing protein n=1 Tax=hydrothermal vent metagenome TaxID=652676 RepID=A0A3B0YSN5_9ZZZZ